MTATLPTVDLLAVIVRDLGPSAGRGARPWWRCPFHEDGTPSLTLTPDGRRWKCFGCGKGGDAIEWLRSRDGLGFREAVERLGGEIQRDARPAVQRILPTLTATAPLPPDDWQAAAGRVVETAALRLWEPAGARALAWLRQRGLHDETIRAARLGYTPGERIGRLTCDRGIVLPWLAGDAIRFVQIRRPVGKPKYKALAGGSRGDFYPTAPRPGRVVLICEGEFDALLARQELGQLVETVTLGGAGDKLTADAALAVCGAPRVLVATDCDAAGESAAAEWLRRTARARRIQPPVGKDLTDAYLAGADLREWIRVQLTEPARIPTAELVEPAPALPTGAIAQGELATPCRCGGRRFVEWRISGGRTRRDCARCGRFVEWGKWQGEANVPARRDALADLRREAAELAGQDISPW